MDPTNSPNSQQGGSAQAIVQQVAGKTLSFFRRNLVMTSVFSALFAVFAIGTIIIFFFGDVGGVVGGQPPPPPTQQTCADAGGTCKASCDTNETEDTNITTPCTSSSSDPSLSKCCVAGSSVVYWAKRIFDAITTKGNCCDRHGCGTAYNVLPSAIINGSYSTGTWPGTCTGYDYGTYFCTYLVKDAYRLAGLAGPRASLVCNQIQQWATIPGYHLEEDDYVTNVRPGDVAFWLSSQVGASEFGNICSYDVHVDIVYNINVDPASGNGIMWTVDANTPLNPLGGPIPYGIVGWQVKSTPWAKGPNGINGVWFGLAH